jgi:hypothetical protein
MKNGVRKKHSLPASTQWTTGPLHDARYEKFCLLIVAGIPQSDAYVKAGFRTKAGNSTASCASRLLTNANVCQRITELKAENATKIQESTSN